MKITDYPPPAQVRQIEWSEDEFVVGDKDFPVTQTVFQANQLGLDGRRVSRVSRQYATAYGMGEAIQLHWQEDLHMTRDPSKSNPLDPSLESTSEYAQDKAAGDASWAAQHKSLADVLIEIAEKAGVCYAEEATTSYPFTFGGWQVLAGYHRGEFQHLEHFVNPKGEVVDPWAWPDCHDRTRLLAWRPKG